MSARWSPDTGLVLVARARPICISEISAADRCWVVASLVADGWTVAAIADRLCCSLRLVQQIKADPMTNVAGYAIDLNQKLLAERALRALESRVAEQNAVEDALRVSRLTSQRDVLLDQIRNSSLKGTP